MLHLPDGIHECFLAIMVGIPELISLYISLCPLQFRGYYIMEHTPELTEYHTPIYIGFQFLGFYTGKKAVPLHFKTLFFSI